jgi:hypothetical protein
MYTMFLIGKQLAFTFHKLFLYKLLSGFHIFILLFLILDLQVDSDLTGNVKERFNLTEYRHRFVQISVWFLLCQMLNNVMYYVPDFTKSATVDNCNHWISHELEINTNTNIVYTSETHL